MKVLIAKLFMMIGVFSLIWVSGAPAFAQDKRASSPIRAQENPFDYTMDLLAAPSKAKAGQTQKPSNFAKPQMQLQYRGSLSGGPAQAKTLINNLTLKYGPPKSIRGQSHVWDIENPHAGGTQAKTVTIIVKSGASGEAVLIMDRDRGEDGRATYAAPRIAKSSAPKTQTHKPKLDPRLVNND